MQGLKAQHGHYAQFLEADNMPVGASASNKQEHLFGKVLTRILNLLEDQRVVSRGGDAQPDCGGLSSPGRLSDLRRGKIRAKVCTPPAGQQGGSGGKRGAHFVQLARGRRHDQERRAMLHGLGLPQTREESENRGCRPVLVQNANRTVVPRLPHPGGQGRHEMVQEDTHVVMWTMTLRAKKLNKGRETALQGNSIIRFGEVGLVTYHRDYFDMGVFVYRHVPVVGWLVEKVNKSLQRASEE